MSLSTQLRLVAAILFAGSCFVAAAQDFTAGALSYEILSEEDQTVAIVEGDDYYEDLTTADFPAQVTNDGVTYTVVAIGEYALSGATFAEDIVLPSTITSIGEYGLSECEGERVTLPANLEDYDPTSFQTCMISGFVIDEANSVLATVDGVLMTKDKKTIVCYPAMREGATYVVPEHVSVIGESAFRGGDEYLEEVLFHQGMTIENFAFKDNGNILRVDLPGDIVLSQGSFTGCEAVTELVLGEGIKEVPVNCFFDLCSLTSLTLPSTLEKIQSKGFGFCEELAEVKFPAKLSYIGASAFGDCGKLTAVDFANVAELGEYAFARTGLTAIELPRVTTVGDFAFAQCNSLTSADLSGATDLGASVFFRCPALSDLKLGSKTESIGGTFLYECTAIESLSIPASVTSIGNGMLVGTSALTSVAVDEGNQTYKSVDNIIYTADMKSVVSAPCGFADWAVELPEGVTTVEAMAFRKCAGLVSVVLPNTVAELGNIAFADCTGLTEVVSLNAVPPTGCNFPDNVYTDATLLVADEEALEAYKSAEGWLNFANTGLYVFDGVGGVVAPETTRTEYFDLNGRRVANPANGIFIKRTVYKTGSVETSKTVR